MRGIEPDFFDTQAATARRMYAAMRALAALHPRNAPELMLGVQALSAYHAANAAWRRATTHRPGDDVRRHVTTAASAARAFDSMLRGLERRQAKPLSVPVGRPPPGAWPKVDLEAMQQDWQQRTGLDDDPDPDPTDQRPMTDDEMVTASAPKARRWLMNPNEGLDIANTPGILPGGGMIMPADPTPAQAAYLERRLVLMYHREKTENRRNGIATPIRIRPTRPGDLIP
jgi:hypothetical protein